MPSSPLWSAAAVIVGGTLFTCTVVLSVVAPPSLSITTPVTVYMPLSGNVQPAVLVAEASP